MDYDFDDSTGGRSKINLWSAMNMVYMAVYILLILVFVYYFLITFSNFPKLTFDFSTLFAVAQPVVVSAATAVASGATAVADAATASTGTTAAAFMPY